MSVNYNHSVGKPWCKYDWLQFNVKAHIRHAPPQRASVADDQPIVATRPNVPNTMAAIMSAREAWMYPTIIIIIIIIRDQTFDGAEGAHVVDVFGVDHPRALTKILGCRAEARCVRNRILQDSTSDLVVLNLKKESTAYVSVDDPVLVEVLQPTDDLSRVETCSLLIKARILLIHVANTSPKPPFPRTLKSMNHSSSKGWLSSHLN
ncbi:hypothetical protein EYF80_000950 [Liparis tanakae]|uniref:Uncharacterized protein n=1 Tax=Liparis tanakae TaxID=230148 RepID=A0A4Z2JG60_9TELE|nr:hypothetical protein EYF80_000950 [Liparis tanakae]